ncbi:MAG: hypothetical protein M1319_06415 [Chloroflexi bacterium]|nr:hypothetical protein [Chloroflexota bacterium]
MDISIHEDTTFLITNELGDVEPGTATGLYWHDTRFLSGYQMRLNDQRPVLLDARAARHEATHFLSTPAIGQIQREDLAIIRKHVVGHGLHEDIDINNYSDSPAEFIMTIGFGVDFAHIFEVKGAISASGESMCPPVDLSQDISPDGKTIRIFSREEDFERSTVLQFSQRPVATAGQQSVSFPISLQPNQGWHLCVDIFTLVGQEEHATKSAETHNRANALNVTGREDELRRSEQAYLLASPTMETDHEALKIAYDQSIRALAALRIKAPGLAEGEYLLAAGIPWFMAVFGRDTLITSFQAMPYHPDLARAGLRFLAEHQGTKVDKLSAEEPGKILHEYRFGFLGGCRRIIPVLPYYGTIDATPLFLITLSEYYRTTGDLEFVRGLQDNIHRALDWMDNCGDRDGDGYLEYIREAKVGLANQGWKDSGTAIRFHDGRFPEPPIALCEVQGYAYDARRRSAELLAALGCKEAATQERLAAELRDRFNKDFWMPEHEFYAVALDSSKRKVDSITSNPGQLLWSGIVDKDRAGLIAKRLLSGDMFSGWGVRTMSTAETSYNPIAYQNGSVWPHDNSIIAAGLARYGFFDEAITIILALLAATSRFPGYQPPELFCGYSRTHYDFPVAYPTASSPQAWASAAILLILTSLLRLDFNAPAKKISISPLPPLPGIGFLRLTGIRIGDDTLDIDATSTTDELQVRVVHAPSGFKVITR